MGQEAENTPPAATVEGDAAPVKKIDGRTLAALGQELRKTFKTYANDRRVAEQRWLRNLRQVLGVYDPEVEQQLPKNGSRAYPRVTRAKCISVLSRIMNLMFPGNERNWELTASPSPDMAPEDVAAAVQELMQANQQSGIQVEMSEELIEHAVSRLAEKRAGQLSKLIDDQFTELGGDQTLDWIALNRKVAQSGINYGIGWLDGPYVREVQKTGWVQAANGGFQPTTRSIYKPQYNFLPVWDVYPDMSARSLPGEGYFIRFVMAKSEVRSLADRPGFMGEEVKKYLKTNQSGNYQPQSFENELRQMGSRVDVNEQKQVDPQNKYEIIVYRGPVSGAKLKEIGANVPDDNLADDLQAEVWMLDDRVIKADMTAWAKLGMDVNMLHFFQFDEDDTSPVGTGLPYAVRDSQMSICAATRMTLDNASITCGPNLELNLSVLRPDQDLTSIEARKIWYRDDTDPNTAQFPAVREININGHLQELQSLVTMFMQFADMESFVGPATGGDLEKAPSEPMRTAAGQSMLRGDAALPFKDIVRNYDSFTQSVILSLVQFNRKFNPTLAPAGDYNVIARGATSLIAKEVRGMQIDMLSQTLRPEELDHIDERKFVEAKFAARDMQSMLVPEAEADRRKQMREQAQAAAQASQDEMVKAQVREVLSAAFKNITQGIKNQAAADTQQVNASLQLLEQALGSEDGSAEAR